MTETTDITVWIALSAGILSFFSPCVLPLIPSYLTYITGLSFGQLSEAHPGGKIRMTVLLHTLAFIAGFSVVFITLGVVAGLASTVLREGLVWVQRVAGILVLLFGVHLTGLFHFGVLLGDKRVQLHQKPAGFLGTFVVGLAFAAGWTPCIGPILGSILAMAAGSGEGVQRAVMLLVIYSAGLGIPFLISGLAFHGFLNFFNKFRKHIRIVEIVTGSMLIVVGVLLFFNLFGAISMRFQQWLFLLQDSFS